MKRRDIPPKEAEGSETPLSPVLTIEETAALFRTSVKTIRRAARDGELETFKLGRTTYVLREPLEQRLKAAIPLGQALPAAMAPANPRRREEGGAM